LPLTAEKHESCETKYCRLYGGMLAASHLGTPSLLGKLHRGICNRTFPVISLTSIHSQTEDRSSSEIKGFDEHLRPKKRQKSFIISGPVMFVKKLRILMDSIVFVCVLLPAPKDVWKGDPSFGVVQGTRLQATISSVQPYIDFWALRAEQANVSVEQLVALEKEMRQLWIDKFRNHVQLATCMIESISENKGVVAAELKAPTLKELMDPLTGQRVKKGGTSPIKTDYSKLPGFDPSISTVKTDKGGKKICKHYNIQMGCRFGEACNAAHVCDVNVNGKACGSTTHIRTGHKAALAGGGSSTD